MQIKPEDIDLNTIPIRIRIKAKKTKTRKNRFTFISTETKAQLEEWLKFRPTFIKEMKDRGKERKIEGFVPL